MNSFSLSRRQLLLAGMGAVAWAASATNVAFLWHNVIGAVAVIPSALATRSDSTRSARSGGHWIGGGAGAGIARAAAGTSTAVSGDTATATASGSVG